MKRTLPVPSPVERKTRNSRRSASPSAAGVGRASASSRKRASVAWSRCTGTRSRPNAKVRPGSAAAIRASQVAERETASSSPA